MFVIGEQISLDLYSDGGISRWIAAGTKGLLRHTTAHGWLVHNGSTGAFQIDYAEAVLYQVLREYETLLFEQITRVAPADQDRAYREYRVFRNQPRKKSVIEAMTHEPEITALPMDFDADNALINCAGVAVSTDGSMRPSTPEDHFTMSAAVKPETGEPEEFMKFLKWAACGNQELMGWLLTACGTSLFGHYTDRITNFYGQGSNGKGTLLRTLQKIIGDYATTLPRSLVIKEPGSQSRFDKAGLPGKRAAILYDLKPDHGKLNLDELKSIAGDGDGVWVEKKGRDGYSCSLKCKVFIASNDKIPIDSFGKSEKKRFRLVPFNAQFETKNEGLEDSFIPEYGKILNLFMQYAVKYYANGRKMPDCKAIDAATLEYFDEQDLIKQFLEDSDAFTVTNYEPKSEFYAKFERYCLMQQGIRTPMKSKTFTNELEKRGIFTKFRKIDGKSTRVFVRENTETQENLNFELILSREKIIETNTDFNNSCVLVSETTATETENSPYGGKETEREEPEIW
ncbi:phage/plasmid primase, P4 family [Leadbettera azotonutricia ZAS-9]|uniref:Phage/plasmid primase, P4 family n=1 Tax=Leadbettera azotonutricia (strain ATCC BAA-888 / DSM 13862 / ZAS-9) TaxID=545695 RepID=F5YBI9_LEAAZ|nr:phage/plasmid primase, P4 family [Leadbettera azotonutricia ZAS-9]